MRKVNTTDYTETNNTNNLPGKRVYFNSCWSTRCPYSCHSSNCRLVSI